jgi:hypothetical protein
MISAYECIIILTSRIFFFILLKSLLIILITILFFNGLWINSNLKYLLYAINMSHLNAQFRSINGKGLYQITHNQSILYCFGYLHIFHILIFKMDYPNQFNEYFSVIYFYLINQNIKFIIYKYLLFSLLAILAFL